MTTTISYHDLDHVGPYKVSEVESALATEYGLPALMNRVEYVHFAKQVGLRRVLHNRPGELIGRDKLAREVTRHLNYHTLKDTERPENDGQEESTGRVWM